MGLGWEWDWLWRVLSLEGQKGSEPGEGRKVYNCRVLFKNTLSCRLKTGFLWYVNYTSLKPPNSKKSIVFLYTSTNQLDSPITTVFTAAARIYKSEQVEREIVFTEDSVLWSHFSFKVICRFDVTPVQITADFLKLMACKGPQRVKTTLEKDIKGLTLLAKRIKDLK